MSLQLPLAGIRVLDLSRLYPGPLCTLILSDLGAEVIKVEEPKGGDTMRAMATAGSFQAAFHALNRGKKSLTLDLKQKSDRDLFLKLALDSDVIVESFRPQVFEKLLELDTSANISDSLEQKLKQLASQQGKSFRGIIVARISAFGNNFVDKHFDESRQLRNFPAHDFNLTSRAGMFLLSRIESCQDIPPMPVQIADVGAAQMCATQILAALLWQQRDASRTGRVTVIDSSMYDVALSAMSLPLSMTLSTGHDVANGKFLLCGSIPSYDIYRAKDDTRIAVGGLELHFWDKFVELVGLDDSFKGVVSAYATGKRKDKIKAIVEERLGGKSALEWEALFQKAALPITALRSPSDVQHDPLIEQRRMVSTVNEGKKTIKCVNPALDYVSFLRKTGQETIAQSAPRLGEHNNEILSKL